ncbi:membrane progestin receptor gamma-B-like [Acanthaster planci]|uniref:Membrane progestin receptor gamma-B-like n=1 Tax=Acanthaster planci TaxID=133434 RepID=A0A8B7YLM6_ACAPL|nr:membrane progestin receptor gamma-B-like [Acanthaster planci]XP_022094169.1 membrane progestin receptor gamma-B-like [Acanthaster planci]
MCSEMCAAKLQRADQISESFREPFIFSGYRSCHSSVSSCILSAFSWNNETFNFWTHFITFLYFSWIFTQYLWHELRFDVDPFTYPLQVFIASICLCMLVSSTAHLFNCISERIHHICFFFDYSAISIYGLATCLMYNVYIFPQSLMNSAYHELYFPISVVISLLCTFLACAARLVKWKMLRISAFSTQYLFCSFPLLYRCVFCEDHDCDHPGAIQFHVYQFILCTVTVLVYGSRFPEVVAPGKFDIVGHSHQFFHIFSSLANYCQLRGNILDMQHRRDYLLSELPMPTLFNTAGVVVGVLMLNLIIIGIFSSFIWENMDSRKAKQKTGILTILWQSGNNNILKEE